MNNNNRSQIKIVLIAMAVGLSFAVTVGAIAGTFNLSAGVFVPLIVVPVIAGTFLFLKNRQSK
jgi:hypothetical protein